MGFTPSYLGPGSASEDLSSSTGEKDRVAVVDFELVQHGTERFTWTITDANGLAVDLSAKTIRLTLFTNDGTTPVTGIVQYESAADLTVSVNRVTRTFSTTDSGTKRVMHYVLWNQTDGRPLFRGRIRVTPALRTVS